MRTQILIIVFAVAGIVSADELTRNFVSPPVAARLRTCWFHMSGNTTKPDIRTADGSLELAAGRHTLVWRMQ